MDFQQRAQTKSYKMLGRVGNQGKRSWFIFLSLISMISEVLERLLLTQEAVINLAENLADCQKCLDHSIWRESLISGKKDSMEMKK